MPNVPDDHLKCLRTKRLIKMTRLKDSRHVKMYMSCSNLQIKQ